MHTMNNIYLIGFAGVGKSTLGKQLAEDLDMDFLDTDMMIEEKLAKTIPQIFDEHGEGYFRKKENQLLKHLVHKNTSNKIISTGGGMPTFNNNLELMQESGVVVWLERRLDDLYATLKSNPRKGVYFNSKDELEDLYEMRKEYYMQAEYKIQVDDNPITEIKNQVLSWVS